MRLTCFWEEKCYNIMIYTEKQPHVEKEAYS